MTIYLNDFADHEDCYYNNQHGNTESEGGFSAEFGQWYDRWFSLRNGLELAISTDEYSDFVIERCDADEDCLKFQFCLFGAIKVVASGGSRSVLPGADFDAGVGQSLLSHLPEPYERQYPAVNQRTQWVRLFCPTNFLMEFQRSYKPLPQPLQALVEGDFTQPICQTGSITPAMRLALQQVLQHPFQGCLQQLYLEGKILELLALQFGQWVETEAQAQPSWLFRLGDIERLHHAKAILNQTFQNPPSLMELARQVGLNDCKLKHGFRDLFKTTVFGHVQSLRLKQAKQLLQGTELTIAEIAQQVGYGSTSHFGYLFKRQFGVTPKAYRQQ